LVALYVTSSERAAGKTALCAGIGKYLLDSGRKVAYLRPLTAEAKNQAADGESHDASFMKRILALEASEDVLCPALGKLREAYAQVSQGKDVVLVEDTLDNASSGMLEALDARLIIVVGYSTGLPTAEIIDSGKKLGRRLLGVVVNKVPGKRLDQVNNELSARFAGAGITVLGVLPEDRALASLTVGELAEHLQGEMLNAPDRPVELVENFMLGALGVDSGLEYFGRKTSKAVVTRGERPDLQLAALETPTKCLVLTGNTAPIEIVLHRAEEKEVPIIVAREDTSATIASIEAALSRVRFNQEKKLPIITDMIKQRLNLQALSQGLGLAG
jgi:BioD-like phosphotransacetylase family protein